MKTPNPTVPKAPPLFVKVEERLRDMDRVSFPRLRFGCCPGVAPGVWFAFFIKTLLSRTRDHKCIE